MQIVSPLKAIFFCVTALVLASVTLCSCGDTRQLVYMQGKFDTAKLSQVTIPEPVIQKGDLISIVVYSDNPAATALYNQFVIAGAGSTSGSNTNPGGGTGSQSGITSTPAASSPGYLVDEMGNIEFQGLGLLHIAGLTRMQLKELLDSKLKEFLKNPYYSIRFLNYRFTILGEVTRPGIYNIPGEHLSLMEALGLAGDLTFYGRRDNVLIMREANGVRTYERLDLRKPEIMASPYYYLQQNDVVLVEPTKRKVAANDQVTARNVTLAATIVSTIAIIYSIFRK
ncbi:MAG: polysaccharide biosynthesis/export family protein [Bacteroidetes bacterium]|nr:polysaccharide biosynthesis/export family protein [Bacteroidota bacterium]